jgi:protein-tyrosine phosphatase
MAEVVLRERLREAGLDGPGGVELVSAGTGGWHVGERMDRRAAATLREAGYDPDHHRAQQWPVGDPAAYDLVLAMDHDNLRDLGGPDERVRLFRDFDPIGTGGDVPDPYYGGDDGFAEVLEMVERTSAAIVRRLVTDDLPAVEEGASR